MSQDCVGGLAHEARVAGSGGASVAIISTSQHDRVDVAIGCSRGIGRTCNREGDQASGIGGADRVGRHDNVAILGANRVNVELTADVHRDHTTSQRHVAGCATSPILHLAGDGERGAVLGGVSSSRDGGVSRCIHGATSLRRCSRGSHGG